MHYTYLCTSTSLVKRAIVMSLAATFLSSQASANASLAATTADIETIEVLGQINSLMIESEIDLTASSSPDLRAQLTQLPSVSINSNGPVTGIVQYRGLYSDRVQVSVDNQLIAGAGPNSMDSPLSHVIGNVSQQVSLYQGIAPVSAGAETIGGAMDISEAMPLYTSSHAYEVNGALNLGHFSNNSDNVSAIVQAVNQSQYIALSADSQSGDSLKAGNGITIPNTFYDRSAMKVRAGIQHNKHRVYVSVSSRNTDESGTPTLAMDIIFIDALVSSLNYQYQFSDTWQFKTSLAANNNEHDMNNFALRENNNPMSHRLNSVSSQGRSIGFGALQTSNEWVNEYGIEARTRTQNSRITNPNMAAFYLHNYRDVTRDIASVFGQWQRNISDDSGLNNYQLGLRLSEVRASANNIDSNMAMMNPAVRSLRDAFNDADKDLDFSLLDMVAKSSFTLNDNIQMQLSAGIKEKAPSYFQLYSWFPLGISAGLADGRNYLGNLSLEKETAHKLDLGFVMKGKNWRFMPNIFYTKIDDYILGLPSNNMPANMIAQMNGIANPLIWQNDEARLVGADFSYAHQFTPELSLTATGQYVRGKQTGSVNQDLYRIAPLSGHVSVKYAAHDYELSATATVVSSQSNVATLQNETASNGYAVFDVQGAYFFDNGFTLTLLIENLLDKQYAQHVAGISRVTSDVYPAGNKQLSPGRNIGAYITYQF